MCLKSHPGPRDWEAEKVEKSPFPPQHDNLGEFSVIVGKGVNLTEEELRKLNKKRTIVYGKCVKQYYRYGTFFWGCPPDYTKAILKLRGPMKGLTPWMKYVMNLHSIWNYGWAYVEHYAAIILRR